MDWSTVRGGASSRDASPRLDRLETLWRVKAPSERVWECVLYRVASGRELRLQPEGKEDAAAMTLLVRSEADLEPTSEAWRAAAIAKGFIEIPEATAQ